MAKIVTLKDNVTDENLYPQTTVDAVHYESGQSLSGLDVEIQSINDTLYSFGEVEEMSSIDGYITAYGSIGSLQGSVVHQYNVGSISEVRIINNLRVGHIALYGFYSSSTFSEETLIKLGTLSEYSTQNEYDETVPIGASYLGVSEYSSDYAVLDLTDKTSKLDGIEEEISEINDKVNFHKFVEMPIASVETGYISEIGSLEPSQNFTVFKYLLDGAQEIRVTNTGRTGSYLLWCFYNSSEFSSTNVVQRGYKASVSTSDSYVVSVPAGATYVGTSIYDDNSQKVESAVSIDINETLEIMNNEIADLQIKQYAYSFDGSNLFVAYLDGVTEMTYWFKHCMANNLFTFYRVGYRTVNRTYPSIEGISSQTGIIPINATGSDNIGPFLMETGGWVGGNHRLTVNDKNYYTAKTDSYKVYIDGEEASTSMSGYADSVLISVQNTIYDPAVLPTEPDATILSSPLCSECVKYSINKNTIEVAVYHKFSSTTTNSIGSYYGMQSMFVDENYIMTPNGEFPSWTSVEDLPVSARFSKADYPYFNRFLEKNTTTLTYQASYLFPDFGLGKHNCIPSIGTNSFMFTRGGTSKDYHHLIASGNLVPLANKVSQWKGAYTFFHSPLLDNTYVLAYTGSINGKDALFISTKQAYSGTVPVPPQFDLHNLSVVECYGITDGEGGQNFQAGGNGIFIESQSSGSLILIFE